MGWFSSARRKAKDLARRAVSSAGRKAVRAARYMQRPVENAGQTVLRRVLKSRVAEDAQNHVLRFIAGELLLMVGVTFASILMYKDEPAWEDDWNLALSRRAFNYVMPCVVSALATETCREPVVNWCDRHTRPVAKLLARWVARNWDKKNARMAVEYGLGAFVGAVAMGLSLVNDPWTTFVLVTQTLLTKIAVGLVKNPDHPVKLCCSRRCREYRELPQVTIEAPVTIREDDLLVPRPHRLLGTVEAPNEWTELAPAPDGWTQLDTAPHQARYELRRQLKNRPAKKAR